MNTEKFTGKSDGYAKYRPSYPAAFVDYLYGEVGFTPDSVIADIGSGTGIFTRLLLERGSTVFGVEPNADMRRESEQALAAFENFASVDGSAENTALSRNSVAFVTVAQAFHWFDREKFRAECARILIPGGKVVLVWNDRDEAQDIVRENDALNREFCPEYKGFSSGRVYSPDDYADFFASCEYREFVNEIAMDGDAYVGRNLSSSYTPKPESDAYAPYVAATRALFAKHCAADGVLRLRYITRSYAGGLRDV